MRCRERTRRPDRSQKSGMDRCGHRRVNGAFRCRSNTCGERRLPVGPGSDDFQRAGRRPAAPLVAAAPAVEFEPRQPRVFERLVDGAAWPPRCRAAPQCVPRGRRCTDAARASRASSAGTGSAGPRGASCGCCERAWEARTHRPAAASLASRRWILQEFLHDGQGKICRSWIPGSRRSAPRRSPSPAARRWASVERARAIRNRPTVRMTTP